MHPYNWDFSINLYKYREKIYWFYTVNKDQLYTPEDILVGIESLIHHGKMMISVHVHGNNEETAVMMCYCVMKIGLFSYMSN